MNELQIVQDYPDGAVLLWGPSQSGKSGFYGCLYVVDKDEAQRQPRKAGSRWVFHPRFASDQAISEDVIRAWQQLKTRSTAKTFLEAEYYPTRRIPIVRQDESGRVLETRELLLIDPAGEHVHAVGRDEAVAAERLRSAVTRAAGLIWLIPESGLDDRIWLLQNIVAFLETGTRRARNETPSAPHVAQLPVPLALCISMIDKIEQPARDEVLKNPRQALAGGRLGETTLRWLEAAFPTIEYFAISATGYKEGEVEPVNVSRAIEWVTGHGRKAIDPPPRNSWQAISQTIRHVGQSAKAKRRRLAIQAVILVIGIVVMRSIPMPGGADNVPMAAPQAAQPGPPLPDRVTLDAALAASRSAASRNEWVRVMDELGPYTLPDGHELTASWDSLVAAAALSQARAAGADGRPFLEMARRRATRGIDALPAAANAAANLRLIRIEACIAGALDCTETLDEDIALTSIHPAPAIRNQARRWATQVADKQP